MADWSDADIRTVKTMWRNGATATEIAAALGGGITRGAVLGKIHRLGLKRGEEAKAPSRTAKAKPARAERPQRTARPALASAANARVAKPSSDRDAEASGPMPIWALGQCQCRWPIGNLLDPPGLFCAAVTADGSSWCPVHEGMVYTGTVRPRPEAAPAREPRLAAIGGRSRF
jgi:GcrA cell cycle regulator